EEVFHLSHRASSAPSRKSSEIAAREAHIDSAASVFRRAQSRTPIVCAGNLSGRACLEDNFSAPMPWRNRKSAPRSAGLLSFLVLYICPFQKLYSLELIAGSIKRGVVSVDDNRCAARE